MKLKSAGEKEMLLQKEQNKVAKHHETRSFFAPISGRTNNKNACNKAHNLPGEKLTFLELRKRKCYHPLSVTYCRKSSNCKCSFNQFSELQKCPLLEKKNTFYQEYLPMAASSTVMS